MSSNGWLSIDDYLNEVDLSQTDDSFTKLHNYYSSRVSRKGPETTKMDTLNWRLRTSRPDSDFMLKTPMENSYPGGYLRVSIHNIASNLDIWSMEVRGLQRVISIGLNSRKYFKDHISLQDVTSYADSLKELYELDEVSLQMLGFKEFSYDYSRDDEAVVHKRAVFRTEDDWYSNYVYDGVDSVHGDLSKACSNLDLWTISVSGNDGYGKSMDILGKAAAEECWDYLVNKSYVNKIDIVNFLG